MRLSSLNPLLLLVLVGCGSTSPAAMPSEGNVEGAPVATSEAPAVVCSELSEAGCLASLTCTLTSQETPTQGYLCRDAVPPCETGFAQGTDRSEDCTAKAGCTFVPAQCYCPPGQVCICGGGPPPRCIAEDSSEPRDPAETA